MTTEQASRDTPALPRARRVQVALSVGKVLLLVIVGIVLAFYPVFAVVFTDKHSQSDHRLGPSMIGSTFLIVAGITSLLMRAWRYPLVLALPSTLVLFEYSRTERQQTPYHVAV